MGIINKLKKYLKGQGGIKCMECGYYEEGADATWYEDEEVSMQAYPTCPKCGSGKTNQGILVTKDDEESD